MSDVKVEIRCAKDTVFYYPDVVVTCSPSDQHPLYVVEPTLLVEVLSDSTDRVDRCEKFLSYTRLPSLTEYLLVSQKEPVLTLFEKSKDWEGTVLRSGETLHFPSLDFAFPLTNFTLPSKASHRERIRRRALWEKGKRGRM